MKKLFILAFILTAAGCAASGPPTLPDDVRWAPVTGTFQVRGHARNLKKWRCPGDLYLKAESVTGWLWECECVPPRTARLGGVQ